MIRELLQQNKSVIVQKWFELIIESYPADSGNFLKKAKNRFGNPVGYTIAREIEPLYDYLFDGDNNKLASALENIVRIRTVQDFTASQAVNFIFMLKKVIRELFDENIPDKQNIDELLEFELKIDKLALMSFDVYMKCREKIYEIRVNESKRKTFKLMEKINSTSGNTEQAKD